MPAKVAGQKKPAAPKKPSDHPKYSIMITAAVTGIKDRKGVSRQAIVTYVKNNYKVGENVSRHTSQNLKRMVTSGALTKPSGSGAAGRFRISQPPAAPKTKKVVKKKAAPAKPAAKPKTPKKKPAAKKAVKKSPKKAAAKPAVKKSPKKASPKKKVQKKAPAKKTQAKKPAAKKTKAKK